VFFENSARKNNDGPSTVQGADLLSIQRGHRIHLRRARRPVLLNSVHDRSVDRHNEITAFSNEFWAKPSCAAVTE
jgi:hypothetical protein